MKDKKLRQMAIDYAHRKVELAIQNYEQQLRMKELEICGLRWQVEDLRKKLGEKP
jgi:hypothetical protein